MVGRKELDIKGTVASEADANHITEIPNGFVGFNERDKVDCKITCDKKQVFIMFTDYYKEGALSSFISPIQHAPLLASVVGSLAYFARTGSKRTNVRAVGREQDVEMSVTGLRVPQESDYVNIKIESTLKRGAAITALPFRFEQRVELPVRYLSVFDSSLICVVLGLLDEQIPGVEPIRLD